MGAGELSKDVWHREAATAALRNGIQLRRWGMRVTVYDDPTPANNGDWVLTYNLASTNRRDNSNWLKVADIGQTWGGGGGGSYTFTNGISESGGTVVLGGAPLIMNTTIDADGFDFEVDNANNILFRATGGTIELRTTNDEINIFSHSGIELRTTGGGDILLTNGSFASLYLDTTDFQFLADSVSIYTAGGALTATADGGITLGDNTGAQLLLNGGFVGLQSSTDIFIQAAVPGIGGIDIYAYDSGTFEGTGIQVFPTNQNFITRSLLILDNQSSPTWEIVGIDGGGGLNFRATTAISFGDLSSPSFRGAEYISDYRANYTDRSLADWGNVISQIGGNAVDSLIQNPTAGQDGYVISWNNSNLEWELVPQSGGGGSPGGVDTEIQINDSGSFGGGKVYIPSDGHMVLGDTSTSGGRSIFMESSDLAADFLIGTDISGQIRFRKGNSQVSIKTSLRVYADSSYTTPIGGIGNYADPLNSGGTELRVVTHETFTHGVSFGDANGQLLKFRGASATATAGNIARTGSILISAGRKAETTPPGDVYIGDVLINSYEPANAGTYGNLSIWNSVVDGSPDFKSGEKITYIGNAITAPTANADNGFFLYSDNGEAAILNETGPVQKLSGRATAVVESGTSVSLTQAHRGAIVKLTNNSPVTVTLSDLGADFQCTILYTGSGSVSFAGFNSFNSAGGLDQITSQYGMCYLYHESSNNWYATGDLT